MTQLLRKTTADPVAACSMLARLVRPVLLSCLLLLLPPRTETRKLTATAAAADWGL